MIGELNQQQIERVLQAELIGRIGCHAEGKTYVVPVTYVYQEGCIYGHTGAGLKLQMLRQNPEVCFEIDHLDNLSNWQSVICWGHFEELKGEDSSRAMELLVDRLRPLMTSQTSYPHGSAESGHGSSNRGSGAVVYRIRVGQKTGRFEKN